MVQQKETPTLEQLPQLAIRMLQELGEMKSLLEKQNESTSKEDDIEVLSFDPTSMQLQIRVVCSKGTYIRALARDIGERLHSGAHLIALRRTRVGDIRVEDCISFEQFEQIINQL